MWEHMLTSLSMLDPVAEIVVVEHRVVHGGLAKASIRSLVAFHREATAAVLAGLLATVGEERRFWDIALVKTSPLSRHRLCQDAAPACGASARHRCVIAAFGEALIVAQPVDTQGRGRTQPRW